MDIIPKVGMGDIVLGMSQHQTTATLGKPAFINREKDEETWLYQNSLELTFIKADLYLLGSITITHKSARLYSETIIGCHESDHLRKFRFLKLDDDFEGNGKDYVSQEKELSVWVTDGYVSNMTVFPEYDSTGDIPIWPKQNLLVEKR